MYVNVIIVLNNNTEPPLISAFDMEPMLNKSTYRIAYTMEKGSSLKMLFKHLNLMRMI